MSDPDAAWNRRPSAGHGYWRRLGAALPMRTALFAVASVWILGCVWSFQEQSNFAASKGFVYPHLLPLVIDGFAVSMAGVAWAASLDARPAIPARLATVVAVAASSTSNGVWAWLRANHDVVTVVLGVAVPVAANLAFEVLLAELRRQVQRRRGLPPPVAVPYPRMIRFVLAPWATFFAWRTMVLEITGMEHTIAPSAAALRARATAEPAEVAEAPPVAEVAAPAPVAVSRSTTAWVSGVDSEEEPAGPELAPPATEPRPSHANRSAPVSPAHSVRPTFVSAQPAETPEPTQPIPVVAPEPPAARPAPAQPAPDRPTARPASDQPPVHQALERPVEHPATAAAHAAPERGPATSMATSTIVDTVPATNGAPAHNAVVGSYEQNDNGLERPVDPRVEQLARQLATMDDADDVTGEMVSQLLQIDVAPRTGRRLLGQARELITRRARAQDAAQGHDPELSVIGGR